MSIESFYIILFVSPLYAAVDHGGAGGYPALMDHIWHGTSVEMKPTVLMLNFLYHLHRSFNITVVVILSRKLFLPIAAVPLAFIGGDYGQLLFTNVSGCIVAFPTFVFFFKMLPIKI
jgi:hypothetical protein